MASGGPRRIPSYIGGIIAIIAGLFFVLYPEFASGFIGILFGIVLLVAGLSEVIGYLVTIKQFREENYGKAAGAEIVLVYSLVIMAIGMVCVIKPDLVLQLMSTVLGIFFLIDGIVKFRREIFVFKFRSVNCWFILLMATLLVVAGILLLVNPFGATKNIIVFSGIAFIVSGVENIWIHMIRKSEKKTRKE